MLCLRLLPGGALPASSCAIAHASLQYIRLVSTQRPLRVFLCAPEGYTDPAVASLVTSLRQLHPGALQIDGLAGPLSQAAGLNSVVDPDIYPQFTLAEQSKSFSWVPNKKHMPGSDLAAPTVHSHARHLQRLVSLILKGRSDSNKNPSSSSSSSSSSSGGLEESPTAGATTTASPSSSSGGGGKAGPSSGDQGRGSSQPQAAGGQARGGGYDAVVPIGGARLNKELMLKLRLAAKSYGYDTPPVIPYMVPGLSDPTMVRGILTRWPVAADHIMCVSPHEPPLFKFSKCPTSFVGHPSVQKVINQQAPGTPHKKQQQQQPQPPKAAANQAWFASDKLRQRANVWKWDGVFADGSAARFWAQHGSQLSRPAAAKGKAGEGPSGISSSSSIHSSKRRPLVALFPGRLERDMAQLMEPLDLITRRLAAVQPGLAAVMVVPPLWVPLATDATSNFALPVVVIPGSDGQGVRDALAGATLAVCNGSEVTLHCVAAGMPMVCIRKLHLLRDALPYQLTKKLLPAAALPNLIAAAAAAAAAPVGANGPQQQQQQQQPGQVTAAAGVPEVVLWSSSSIQKAAAAAEKLLLDPQARAEQVEFLKQVVRGLLPPQPPAPPGQPPAPVTPSDAAAKVLLQLMQQHLQAQQGAT